MENLSDDEEIQCMELLEGNYQLFMNWPNSSSASSTAGGGGRMEGGAVGGEGPMYGEGCSASSSSSVNANLAINLFPGGIHLMGPPSLSPPPPAPACDVLPISNPLAGNRFWHTIKSRPLIKTAIVRYNNSASVCLFPSCVSVYWQLHFWLELNQYAHSRPLVDCQPGWGLLTVYPPSERDAMSWAASPGHDDWLLLAVSRWCIQSGHGFLVYSGIEAD